MKLLAAERIAKPEGDFATVERESRLFAMKKPR
jgi:hypothetical protein